MASADSLQPLGQRVSLGQCRPCPFAPSGSTGAVDDSRASLVLACSPPLARLAARSCSYGRRFASGPFAWVPCGSHLAVRLRLSPSPRRGPFTPRGSAPARHTSAGVLAGLAHPNVGTAPFPGGMHTLLSRREPRCPSRGKALSLLPACGFPPPSLTTVESPGPGFMANI